MSEGSSNSDFDFVVK